MKFKLKWWWRRNVTFLFSKFKIELQHPEWNEPGWIVCVPMSDDKYLYSIGKGYFVFEDDFRKKKGEFKKHKYERPINNRYAFSLPPRY